MYVSTVSCFLKNTCLQSILLLQKELLILHFVRTLSWDAKWRIKFIIKIDIQEIITAFEEIYKYPV